MKTKLIRDSVHGYIEVPEIIMQKIVDTSIFQRLRQIEQTSMRTLYPSAHHDRFVHSIGVYHLGKKAIDGLINNIKDDEIYTANKDFWQEYGLCFQLACLLHDCGHAPMSHSFEYGYLDCSNLDCCEKQKERLLKSMMQTQDEKSDFAKLIKLDVDSYFDAPKKITPHELVSAILVSEIFKEAIKDVLKAYLSIEVVENKIYEYIAFMERAIIGLQYGTHNESPHSLQDCFKNCLITLLNGNFFDVDKLDYIVRDTVESGANNISIDIPRILNALTLVEIHNFEKETEVAKLELNNSIYFTGCKSILSDRDEHSDNECTLKLSGVHLKGLFQGSLELTGSDDQLITYNEHDEETSSSKNTKRTFDELTKIDAFIRDNGNIVGKFNGSIEMLGAPITGREKIEGILNAQISGKIKGKIIGKLSRTENDDLSYEVGYSKSALGVIEDTLIARNRLYLWIYAHHKVTYTDYIMRNAILLSLIDVADSKKGALEKLQKGKTLLYKMMDIDNMFFNDASANYLLNDNDLLHIMKTSLMKQKINNTLAKEWLSRQHSYAVWKSYVEYNSFFSNLSKRQRKKLWKILFDPNSNVNDEALPSEADNAQYENSILNQYDNDIHYVWIKPTGFKLKEMDSSNIYIVLSDQSVKRFKDVISQEKVTEQYVDDSFFYLYTNKVLTSDEKLNLISFLKSKVKKSD